MPAAAIFGCAGVELSGDERAVFRSADPWGLILFKRNCATRDQVRALTDDFRNSVGRADAPVFIDEEGGRVQRLGPPEWPLRPAAAMFGALYAIDPVAALDAARLNARLIAADLLEVGVTANTGPLLDLRYPAGPDIVGDRAFSADPSVVAALGRAVMDGLSEGGVASVIKHMPGHGRADADSHDALPRVTAARDALAAHDFAPFKALSDAPMGMTAHVVFEAFDGGRPATISPLIIETVIRGVIGFHGMLLSDDLSMKALSGAPGVRARTAIAAGCDMGLHCNADLAEMEAIAASVPQLSGPSADRAARALSGAMPAPEINRAEAELRLANLLRAVVV